MTFHLHVEGTHRETGEPVTLDQDIAQRVGIYQFDNERDQLTAYHSLLYEVPKAKLDVSVYRAYASDFGYVLLIIGGTEGDALLRRVAVRTRKATEITHRVPRNLIDQFAARRLENAAEYDGAFNAHTHTHKPLGGEAFLYTNDPLS